MQTFEERWMQARGLEAEGQADAAIDAYEAILADEPERLYARLRVSTLLQRAGRYRQARLHAVRAADDVRSRRWEDLPHVTRKLLTFDQHRLVRSLVLGADWSHRDVISMSPMLVQHLWLTGDVANALRLCEQALQYAPTHGALNYSRALLLGYSGRAPEAARALEECISRDPSNASAHWSLAFMHRDPSPGSRIPRVRAALQVAHHTGDGESLPYLHYALYRELEAAGETAAAWMELMSGAETKRATLHYDADAEAAAFRRLLEVDVNPSVGIEVNPAYRPVFVLGMPRTGTTLVERLLGNSPEVTAGGELSDFRSSLNEAVDGFLGSQLLPASVDRVEASDLAAAGRDYRERTAWRLQPGTQVLVNKHPENFALSAWILRALPDARIVCLRRAPMDACLSNLKELFSNDSYGYSYNLRELAAHYAGFNRLAMHWQARTPDRFRVLDYEALVANPLEETRALYAFCGLRFQPEFADVTANDEAVTTASAAQVREAVNTRAVGAWRKYHVELSPLRDALQAQGVNVPDMGT